MCLFYIDTKYVCVYFILILTMYVFIYAVMFNFIIEIKQIYIE